MNGSNCHAKQTKSRSGASDPNSLWQPRRSCDVMAVSSRKLFARTAMDPFYELLYFAGIVTLFVIALIPLLAPALSNIAG